MNAMDYLYFKYLILGLLFEQENYSYMQRGYLKFECHGGMRVVLWIQVISG